MKQKTFVLLGFTTLLWTGVAFAQDPGIPALTITSAADGEQKYSLTLQILMFMTALTFLPAVVMMTTSFMRIVIVLAILRQAIGMAQTPSSQIIIGLALFLSFFVMKPVLEEIHGRAFEPYAAGEIQIKEALSRARDPMHSFMLDQTRETDLAMFADIAGACEHNSLEEIPFSLVVPAFVTSELKTAYQIGFLLFIPFLVIDLVVASVLMSMGMMMLSPMMISLPFKILLFVLVDGWSLIMGTLASSFVI
ncbi:MAG TPA: flagellar biosynthetic protein FliP [Gammaproteobacteria bacterium]|nr:flagellar biosynthetic protein FliP [Gammaproteobacteria bacterium]